MIQLCRAGFLLTVTGEDDDTSPLVVRATCERCGAVVSERTYTAAEWPNALGANGGHGAKDAQAALAHICDATGGLHLGRLAPGSEKNG